MYIFVCTKPDYTRIIISEQRKTNLEYTFSVFGVPTQCLHIAFYSVLLDRRLSKFNTSKRITFYTYNTTII